MSELRRVLFIPDSHVPFEDKIAFTLMMKAAERFKPHVIVILGDFADFYAISDHSKDPARIKAYSFKQEVDAVVERLRQLTELGAEDKIFVAGNHEDRLERYLRNRAPELFELSGMNVRQLFQLDAMGWKYVPYKTHEVLGKLHLTHEVGNCGQYAHYRAQAAFEDNVIIGHTHRLGYAVVGNAKGEPHLGAMLGWLGDFGEIDYMHKVRALRDWAHGFGVGYMEPDGVIHVRPIPIIRRSCVLDSELITLR